MFTGIVKTLGRVAAADRAGGDLRLVVAAPGLGLAASAPGDSIAVNGCCLTAGRLDGDAFVADVSRETLALTTLGELDVGDPVNLEPALLAGQPLGGHLVSGHVDGIGTLSGMADDGRSWRFRIAPPSDLLRYIAKKGSVAVDGVSLTVNDTGARDFGVNIVPHTFEHTIFSRYRLGTRVNIEVDQIARYIERLLETRK